MTLPYSFHPNADQQQSDIWYYTYQKWGIDQADKYIDKLHQRLLKIVEEKFSTLRKLPSEANISSDIMFFHYGSHYIFVKQNPKTEEAHLYVLSILHESMDIPARLKAELEQL